MADATPQGISLVLKEIITAEPALIAVVKELGPISAILPAPWNVLSNPAVTAAVNLLPTLLPMLQSLEAALAALPVSTQSS